MAKVALIIRHAEPETLAGNYTSTLVERGFELRPLDVFEGAPEFEEFEPPGLEEIGLIIALGGPQSANDSYPALRAERRFLVDAMASGVPVFGVCLGAQLMSRALGGEVSPTGGYEFGLRKMWVTEAGSRDPVFGKLRVPLVPTLHGECFTVPPGAVELAFGYMLCRDGTFRRQSLAFRFGSSYGFQFEPQLTLDELRVWNRELADDYEKMGPLFDPAFEADANLREFAGYAPVYEAQSREMLEAFIDTSQAGPPPPGFRLPPE